MEPNAINEQLSVSPQLMPEDVAELAKQGFKLPISNRPMGDGWDQPVFAEIQRAAKKCKFDASDLPVTSGRVLDEGAVAFAKLLEELPRSGIVK